MSQWDAAEVKQLNNFTFHPNLQFKKNKITKAEHPACHHAVWWNRQPLIIHSSRRVSTKEKPWYCCILRFSGRSLKFSVDSWNSHNMEDQDPKAQALSVDNHFRGPVTILPDTPGHVKTHQVLDLILKLQFKGEASWFICNLRLIINPRKEMSSAIIIQHVWPNDLASGLSKRRMHCVIYHGCQTGHIHQD